MYPLGHRCYDAPCRESVYRCLHALVVFLGGDCLVENYQEDGDDDDHEEVDKVLGTREQLFEL